MAARPVLSPSTPAERLLSAAARLFAERGYLGVSVRELLAAADVTSTVLYYHFGSKEGLFRALARRIESAYEEDLAEAAGVADSGAERIRRICRAHAGAVRARALVNTTPEATLSHPQGPTRPPVGRALELLSALVADGSARGEFRPCDPLEAATALVAAAELVGALFTTNPGVTPGPAQDVHGFLDRVIAVILRGVALDRAGNVERTQVARERRA